MRNHRKKGGDLSLRIMRMYHNTVFVLFPARFFVRWRFRHQTNNPSPRKRLRTWGHAFVAMRHRQVIVFKFNWKLLPFFFHFFFFGNNRLFHIVHRQLWELSSRSKQLLQSERQNVIEVAVNALWGFKKSCRALKRFVKGLRCEEDEVMNEGFGLTKKTRLKRVTFERHSRLKKYFSSCSFRFFCKTMHESWTPTIVSTFQLFHSLFCIMNHGLGTMPSLWFTMQLLVLFLFVYPCVLVSLHFPG